MEIEVSLKAEERSYKIYIANGLISQIGSTKDVTWRGQKVFILTDPTVRDLYLEKVQKSLEQAGAVVFSKTMAAGEASKCLGDVERIYGQMFADNLNRDSILICLGGGVIGDLGGFVASIYKRGIPFIQIPTTLLAQVDSSIGGKVGINVGRRKNQIGSFYPPKAVYVDPEVLSTLDDRERKAGMAEVVKYGMIKDEDFFKFLEKVCQKKELDPEDTFHMIEIACQIKAEVVSKDEKEAGLRGILNFGHTFGHGIENQELVKEGEPKKLLHGEAIAIGMVQACLLAEKFKKSPNEIRARLTSLLQKINLPVNMPQGYEAQHYQAINDAQCQRFFRMIKKRRKEKLPNRP